MCLRGEVREPIVIELTAPIRLREESGPKMERESESREQDRRPAQLLNQLSDLSRGKGGQIWEWSLGGGLGTELERIPEGVEVAN